MSPENSQETRKYLPSAEKSAWLTPAQRAGTALTWRIVWASRKTSSRSADAITTAYRPSGVKYRLYGSCTRTGRPTRPVPGSIGVRLSPRSLLTHSVRRSQDGTTCWGSRPTAKVRITRYVAGSITETVSDSVFGTQIRGGTRRTWGARRYGRSAA